MTVDSELRYSTAREGWSGWAAGFAVALGLHGAVGIAAMGWHTAEQPYVPPPAAVMIDLAPLPVAPTTTPTEIPPGPQQALATPPPPEPEPQPEPPKIEPTPLVEKPVVALPPPKPKLLPKPPKPVAKIEPPPDPVPSPRPPTPATTAPQAAPVEAAVAAAPRPGASSLPPSNALPTWRGLLLGHLERLKRYPAEAQWRRQQGVVYLRFTMNREGRVLNAAIEKSSGVASLDEEVMALIQRAQPLPPPPADVPGDPLELIVPVQFFLK
jgi:protein TonB